MDHPVKPGYPPVSYPGETVMLNGHRYHLQGSTHGRVYLREFGKNMGPGPEANWAYLRSLPDHRWEQTIGQWSFPDEALTALRSTKV